MKITNYMNKFINKTLKEAKEDDSFFQPKDIERRLEERQREIVSKAESGLENIKIAYQNKKWNSEEEKSFLEIFSKLHLNKINDKEAKYYFESEQNEVMCLLDLENNNFVISYDYIWLTKKKCIQLGIRWEYDEIKSMINKYFKFEMFTFFTLFKNV